MGGQPSKLEKALGASFPENEHYLGFENFGNTCYCNSVLQALYYCAPFRNKVLEYAHRHPSDDETLLGCLADLFVQVNSSKKKTGSVAPRKFVQKLRKENELFRGYAQQDAHEFFNFLINDVAEYLQKQEKANGNTASLLEIRSWVHDLFAGTLTSETKCLTCETVTSRDEMCFDLSVDVQQNCSLTACLRSFSSVEMLARNNKFHCDKCASLQEAQKRICVKKLPKILAIHLKRFKYVEQLQRFKKLSYRVVFPHELRLVNTIETDGGGPDFNSADDILYSLFAVVVHIGSGPNHGHYISMIKSQDHWILFDDGSAELIDESEVESVFGLPHETTGTTETGYLLFFEALDCPVDMSRRASMPISVINPAVHQEVR
eukprot:ANDGO_04469.mRNA.1 Ubiquitin carboxyl-terminal hydrolase 4